MAEPNPGNNGGADINGGMSRREFLRRTGLVGGAAALAWGLAACTPRPVGATRTEAPSDTPTFTPTQIIEAAVTLPAPTSRTAVRATAAPTHAPDIRPATVPTAETVDLVEPKEITDAAEALPGVGGPTEGAFLEPGWIHEMQKRVADGKATSSDWVMDGIYRLSLYAKQTGKPVRVGNGMAGFAASISKGKELKLTNYPGSSGQEIDKVKSADAAKASVTIFAQTSADGQTYYLAEVVQKVGSATKVELAWLNGADVAVVLPQNAVVGKLNSQAVMAVHNTLRDIDMARAKAIGVIADGVPTIEVKGAGTLVDPEKDPYAMVELQKSKANYAKAMGIAPEKIKLDYKVYKDSAGNTLVFAVTPENMPLLVSVEGEWRSVGLKDVGELVGLEMGDALVYKKSDFSVVTSEPYHETLADNYNVITLSQGAYWKWFERQKDAAIDRSSISDLKAQIEIIKEMKKKNPSLRIRLAPFGTFPASDPDWIKGLRPEEAKAQLREHMQQLYDLLVQNGLTPDEYVVTNEPFFRGNGWERGDALYSVLGYDYIPFAFSTARAIAGKDAVLIYNDTANSSEVDGPHGFFTGLTRNQITALHKAGIKDVVVGMQMHLVGNVPVNKADLVKTMKSYGAPIFFTELDVDLSMIPEAQKKSTLSKIYQTVFEAALESGVCKGITCWNGVDDLSWLTDGQGKKGAYPTLFENSDDPAPKKAYYDVLGYMFSKAMSSSA